MPELRNQKKDATIARILDAAEEEFIRHGFEATRMSAVADAAGVTKGLVSQRFSSKEELLCALLRQKIDKYPLTQPVIHNLDELLRLVVRNIKLDIQERPNNFHFAVFFFNDKDIPASAHRIVKDWLTDLGFQDMAWDSIRAGHYPNKKPYELFTVFVRLVAVITGNFSAVGLPLPTDEEYLKFILLDADRTLDLARERIEEATASSVINTLSSDYSCIMYVPLQSNALDDACKPYRTSDALAQAIPGWNLELNFHNRLNLLCDYFVHPRDRERFYQETRRDVVMDMLSRRIAYYVEFSTLLNGHEGHYQMKFIADYRNDNTPHGFTVGIHNIDDEISRARETQRKADIINILTSEYDAVFYCDATTQSYEVLYQEGASPEVTKRVTEIHKTFDDAIVFYAQHFVHPEDCENFLKAVKQIPLRLETQKSVSVEFRRRYGSSYLYTMLDCVKTGAAGDPITGVVVGFMENDEEYRNSISQQKQLELIVSERTSELLDRNQRLTRINNDIVELLGNITEARDISSGEHVRRVKGFTHILATQLMNDWPEYGLSYDTIDLMTSASALHDIGKIMIPDAILKKPDKLTEEEFEEMKKHCDYGCQILKKAPRDWSEAYLAISMDVCRFHHEKYDGLGYPLGLKGEEIPISAQIVSVADCYDALTSERVYKGPYTPEEAYTMIQNGECGAFSGKILSSFAKCQDAFVEHTKNTSSSFRSALPTGSSTGSLDWMRFLLVDDNNFGRSLSADVLRTEGATVVEVTNAKEAIRIFEESTPCSFDVILLDNILPDMDGPTTASVLRSMCRSDAHDVTIIGMAALATSVEVSRCLASGMDSVLNKPFTIMTLNKVLYQCVSKRKASLTDAVKKISQQDDEAFAKALSANEFLKNSSEEYNFLCYINGLGNTITSYYASPDIKKIIKNINPRLPQERRFDRLLLTLLDEATVPKFLEDVQRGHLVNLLQEQKEFVAEYPAKHTGAASICRLRMVLDKDNPNGYILGLQLLHNKK